jgi:hypothetical protein
VGVISFEDVATPLGLPPIGSSCLGFEDFDGDDRPDVVMVAVSQTDDRYVNIYLNTGNGFFHVVTSPFKIPGGGFVHCAVGDLDSDGLPDLAVTVENIKSAYVLHNSGGGHLDATSNVVTLPSYPGDLGIADFDGDGDLDVVSSTFRSAPTQATCAPTDAGYACVVPSPRCSQPPVVLLNDGTGTLAAPISMIESTGCGAENVNALSVTDYDGDGRPDVFVANDWGYDSLFINAPGDGGGLAFNDIAPTLGLKGYNHAMGAAFADYDLDGHTDLFVSDMGCSQFYLGQPGGGLVSKGVEWGVAGATTFTSEWAANADDFDSDGFTDVWVTNSAEVHDYGDLGIVAGPGGNPLPTNRADDFVFQNTGGHGFSLVIVPQTLEAEPAAVLGGNGIADYDGDGSLDVVELVGYPPRVQLMHNTSPRGHWLEVRLQGHASNRDGIGARVTLKQSGRPDVSRLMMRSRGSVGQSWAVAHFGLGQQTDVSEVDVAWPSGATQSVPVTSVDQILHVEETAP